MPNLFPATPYVLQYDLGTLPGMTSTALYSLSFSHPGGLGGVPYVHLQPLCADASNASAFTTRIVSIASTATIVTVLVRVTKVTPVGIAPGPGWGVPVQLNLVAHYPMQGFLRALDAERADYVEEEV